MRQFDLHTLATFQAAGPSITVLVESDAARVVLFAFRADQQLPEHQIASQILFQVLQGSLTFTAANTPVEMREGMLLELDANVRHSVVAHGEAVALLTQTPNPLAHNQTTHSQAGRAQ